MDDTAVDFIRKPSTIFNPAADPPWIRAAEGKRAASGVAAGHQSTGKKKEEEAEKRGIRHEKAYPNPSIYNPSNASSSTPAGNAAGGEEGACRAPDLKGKVDSEGEERDATGDKGEVQRYQLMIV